ncbi:MAG: hypothetical protein ACTSU5_08780 [Promethearchaeota archaeon]
MSPEIDNAPEYMRFISAIVPPRVPVSVSVVKPHYPVHTTLGPGGFEVELPDGDPYSPKSWVWMTREALRIKFGLVFDSRVNELLVGRLIGAVGAREPTSVYHDNEVLFTVAGNLALDWVVASEYPGIPYVEYARQVLGDERLRQDLPDPDRIPGDVHGLHRWAWGRFLDARFPGAGIPTGACSLPAAFRGSREALEGALSKFFEDPVAGFVPLIAELAGALARAGTYPFFEVDARERTRVEGADAGGDLVGRGGRFGDIFTDRGKGGGEVGDADGIGVKIGQGGKIGKGTSERRLKILGYLPGDEAGDGEGAPKRAVVKRFSTAPAIAEYIGKRASDGEALYGRVRAAFSHYIEALRTRYQLHKNIRDVARNQTAGRLHVPDAITTRAEHRFNEASARMPFCRSKNQYGDALLFLLDLSGSMRGIPMKILQCFVVVISEVLEGTPTKFAFVGSGAKPGELEISEVVFKGFGERVKPEKLGLVDVSLDYCENRDSDALVQSAAYLGREVDAESLVARSVVLINDELPNHVGLTGEEGQRATLEALTRLRHEGIEVFGISFNARELDFLRERLGNDHFIRVEPFPDPTAGGEVSYRIMTGIRVREYFFDVLFQVRQMCEFVLEILSREV